MPTYRGNRGNLLQHWVLVDLIEQLSAANSGALCYIDAHSMSPFATRSSKARTDPTAAEFDRIRDGLESAASLYETTWRSLTQSLHCQYPSSAAFAQAVWPGSLHLLLCEADPNTATEIGTWLRGLDAAAASHELFHGTWQARFRQGLPADFRAYLISFDPNMYVRQDADSPKPENMYGSDARLAACVIQQLPHVPIAVQLSTYSANGPNRQPDVIAHIVPFFAERGLPLSACVHADQGMMSLVFTRDFPVLPDMEARFRSWHADRKARAGAA